MPGDTIFRAVCFRKPSPFNKPCTPVHLPSNDDGRSVVLRLLRQPKPNQPAIVKTILPNLQSLFARCFPTSPLLLLVGLVSISLACPMNRAAGSDPRLDTLRLDYAYYNPVSLVIKDQGLVEKEFAVDGTKVGWVLSLGSNKALEFLRAKAVDFGSTAGAAAFIGRANGNPIKSIYLYSNPEWTALVTRADAGIKTIADLRGKKVAVTRGTDPHIFLLRALASAGLTEKDIELVPLQHPDGKVALQNKSVAAWSGLDPYIAQTQVDDGFPVFYRNRDWNSGGFLNVHETFAKEHPDAVVRVLKVYEQARRWAVAHPAETKAILAREAKLTPEVVDRVWERTDLTHPAIGDANREGITAAGEVLKRSGIIDADVDVSKTVNDLIAPGFGEKALAVTAGK